MTALRPGQSPPPVRIAILTLTSTRKKAANQRDVSSHKFGEISIFGEICIKEVEWGVKEKPVGRNNARPAPKCKISFQARN
jgi:hypothetical protein